MNALKFSAILNYNSGARLAQSLGTLQCHPRVFSRSELRQQLLHSPMTIFAQQRRLIRVQRIGQCESRCVRSVVTSCDEDQQEDE
jgi:hypothetical protein